SGLSLDVAGVTVRGRGPDSTILSFAGQTDGAEGLLVTADDFVIEQIGVEDTAGDALKVEGTTNATFRHVRVEWTAGPRPENGSYGLYPVQVTNVLIEDSVVRGASDAGIYVGQSNHIIVRRNRAEDNVAGIEIENSSQADVYQNTSTGNTGGVLVFNLPGLQIGRGEGTRVYDNDIVDNNEPNFAPPGNIVGKVPRGTGFAGIAAHGVEIFDNRISGNLTGNLAIMSYLTAMLAYDDPAYDPYADTIWVHDNQFGDGGEMPTDELGFLVVEALATVLPAPIVVPDMIIDGYENPELSDTGGQLLPDYAICFQGNGDADFADLDVPNDYADVSFDLSAHDCAHDPLPPVEIPGVD
ncbi:MAG TPA: parallel beta-helix domain-containing protein, partial [Kofleriaceae bacterium]|nr:parallel beta-helix domain-containing protein [Kofleriaceae bacterium]